MSINVNSTQITALLQLYPMAIPGAVENLQPPGAYHLGIPESIHSPSTKLFMVIDPVTLFSTSFAAGDSVRLWVNSQATSVIKPIKPGEENDRIFLELPWGGLKDGLNTLHYEVTRVSGNKDKSDPILNVLFNNPVSGITVSHPASIGPGQPATFSLTRSYPREYDVVTLTVGTWSKTIPYVHPANPITYTLTSTDLQQIGDGTHSVSATVVDQLSNRNLSPTTPITITANQKVQNPPIIVEAEPGKTLDVTALAGKDATIHGKLWTGIAVGQQVWLKLTGKKIDGSAVTSQIWNGGDHKVNATWVSQGFWPKSLSASFLFQLADVSSLLMEFRVSEDKSGNFATATKFPDQVYTVKSLVLVDPTLTNVLDAGNNEVPEGTSTTSTSLTVKGKASPGRQVELFDGSGPSAKSLGKVTADSSTGEYVHPFPVAPGAHRLYAQSLYHPGSPVYSNVRNLTVAALVNATITKVNENTATGALVSNGGSTTATTLVISGTASAGQQVQVLMGGKVIATVPAGPTGAFSHTVTGQALGDNSYTVKGLYGTSPVSPPWVVKIVANIVPIIQLITDSNNVTIPNNGSTVSASIIVSGIATPNTKIDLVDGGGPIAGLPEIQVDPQGKWSQTMRNLVPNTYSLRAKRKDGPVSGAYNVTVAALVTPTIGNVNENTAAGKPVASGGFTTATTLVISGKLSPGQQGELYDGSGASAKPLGKVTANATGDYSITIKVAQGAHRFSVKSLYHPGTVYSNVWTLTVVANINATITKVNENTATGALVPNGGVTKATTLVISGPAVAGQQVEVRNHNTLLATVPASAQGVFSYTHVDTTLGARSYTVKGLNGASPVSPAWRLSVVKKAAFLEVRRGDRNPNGQLLSSGATVPLRSMVTFYLKDVPTSHTYLRIWSSWFPDGSNNYAIWGPLRSPPAGTHDYGAPSNGAPMYYWADTSDKEHDSGPAPAFVYGGEFVLRWV